MDLLRTAQKAADFPRWIHEHHARTWAADRYCGGSEERRQVPKTSAALRGLSARSARGWIEKGRVRNHQIGRLPQLGRQAARQIEAPQLRVHFCLVGVFSGEREQRFLALDQRKAGGSAEVMKAERDRADARPQ